METIDYTRWAVYFVFGLPFIAWIFLTRNETLRIAAVVSVLVIIQDSLAARRYVWAIGVGPSIIVAYVALMSAFVQRRRAPTLGWLGGGWALFLMLALSGIIVGSIAGGELPWNVKTFQELFVESLVFFLIGAMAFQADEDARGFFVFLVLLGGVVAVIHFFTILTGYRFADYSVSRGTDWVYGGVFNNPNSMGSFYCMGIPTGLLLVMTGRLSAFTRLLLVSALVLMLGSLMVSTHRGGILVSTLLVTWVLLRSGVRPLTVAIGVVFGAILLLAAVEVVSYLVPETVSRAERLFSEEGLKTERTQIWTLALGIIARNPFGVGLAPENLKLALTRVGMPFASPHNIYLTIAMQVGVIGLALFLSMVGSILLRIRRATRVARTPIQRLNLACVTLCIAAFLIAGIAEPIWENGQKLNNLFWLLCGIGLSLSTRILAERRQGAPESAVAPAAGEPLPAHGL